MFENYDINTGTAILPQPPLASGSIEATIETHSEFKSNRVGFLTALQSIEIWALDDEIPNRRGWSFRFKDSIKPGKYFINDSAINKVWYTRQIPGSPPNHVYVYVPANTIGTITIIEVDLTEGKFKAEFDFSVKTVQEDKILRSVGKIDLWDMEKIQSDSI